MNYANMNIRDFINHIITYDNVSDILDTGKSQSDKGFIFERLFDIIIKFGFCDIFPNSKFHHLLGNSNNANMKILSDFNSYLDESVYSGNSSGCSDITLQNKEDETYIFISSKYPRCQTNDSNSNSNTITNANVKIKPKITIKATSSAKSVDYYDIQNIIAMATKNKDIYKHYKIYLLVPDKNAVLDKVMAANKSSRYITEHMTIENILDAEDLNKGFLAFKYDITHGHNKHEKWTEYYLSPKESLNLRFHQDVITSKTNELITEGNKCFLWGCKCRSGKTYMIGGLILKQLAIKHQHQLNINVLIITPAPTETAPQFTDDLFRKFKDFDQFKIHHLEGSSSIEKLKLDISSNQPENTKSNNIFITSKQLLQKYINSNTIKCIKDLKLDIIAFDENHMSGTTDLSKSILESYSSKNTVKIYLTATYDKPLKEWQIPEELQMYWDIEDEQLCKSILAAANQPETLETYLARLKEKHGETAITNTIKYLTEKGNSISDIFKPYEKMPDLHLITTMFDSQRYDMVKEALNKSSGSNKMGLCFETLFSLNKAKTKFNFENEVKYILRYISGSHKETDGDKTIYTRIHHICAEKDTRIPFTQIWFLPSNNIDNISQCLKKIMMEDLILKKYDVLCINRKNKELAKDIKEDILKQEKIAKSQGKLGVILLAGNMLSLGITLDNCDLVLLLNNTLSADKVFQQMYRCMTEGTNKKIGFVIDLNISRVLNTCLSYTIYKKEHNVVDKIQYLIRNHLINIDVDMILNKKTDADRIINKLTEIWKEDPVNNFRTLLRRLDDDYEEFDNATQRLINKTFTKSLGDGKVSLEVVMKDEGEEIQELPDGKERIEAGSGENRDVNNADDAENKADSDEDEEAQETKISFTKDVLPYIIPLTSILTIKNNNMDFVKILNDIKENPELLEVFNEQCLIWWNKKDLIDLIKNIVSRYFDKNSNTFNISIQFKMSLQSLIDNPKAVLELINDCLKPKEVEKKENGEVFTPMELVNEMLDKLDAYYNIANGYSIFSNKNLKWLDPTCGMGNFPIAVYLRLLEGLKEAIPDINARKKHILEEMLYMAELNKKNVLVCKQIFDINNIYKLNIYQGDSLQVNFNEVFRVDKFDVIMGNPPYNASGTKATGNTIWQKFVNNSIDLLKANGYVCLVHPNGWRKPNTEKGKFYGLFNKMTKENTILYLEIHNSKDGMKQFNCGTRYDWYVLQKKKNENTKTKIVDENNIVNEINLTKYNWLANCELELIDKLIANPNEDKCIILQSMSAYEARKKWISKTESDIFKYPVVHSTPQEGHRFVWSSKNDNGFYGIQKVIFGDSGIYNPIIDVEGKYAMTQHSMAIKIDNIDEGKKIVSIITSPQFTKVLKACLWSSFAIEWGMFKDFKKNFYELLNTQQHKNIQESKQDKNIDSNIQITTNQVIKKKLAIIKKQQ
jgi:hypothetical protein